MTLPESLKQFIDKRIERIAAPLCIEYDEHFQLLNCSGPAGHYGLLDMEPGEHLPEALDFLQAMDQGEPLTLSYVTLPTGVIAHIDLRQDGGRRFIVMFDATEQHGMVQSQQQQANELRLLNTHQQQTLEQLSQAQATVEEQRRELEHLRQQQQHITEALPNHLRAPLNTIVSYADVLAKDHDSDDHIETIRLTARQLLTTVENVLEQQRLSQHQVTIKREPTAIGDLLRLTEDLFQRQAQQRGLSLSVRQTGDIPPLLMLDRKQWRRILINLVDNALRYTTQGEVSVAFAYYQGELNLTVQDTGPGICSEDQAALFRPYATITAPGAGISLGLALCRQLASLMDGNLSVQSQPGKGTRFTLQIPCAIPESNAPPDLQGQALVLDSNAEVRDWLDATLSEWGLQPTTLTNLSDLQRWLQEHPNPAYLPDILITDYVLDDGVGAEAMRLLRHLDNELPVAMLTGSVPREEGARMTHDPHLLLLAKPLSADTLHHSLSTLLSASDSTSDPMASPAAQQTG